MLQRTPPYWTDERVDELKRHHEAKLSARQISVKMGAPSRSAVLGKLHRLGLSEEGISRPRLTDAQREQSRQRRNASRVVRQRTERQAKGTTMQAAPVKSLPPFIGSLNLPFAELRPFSEFEANQCRYSAAEIPGPDYLVCGNETLPGESWCGHCKDIVFNRGQVISDEDRARRSAHARKAGGLSPTIIRISPDLPDIEEEAA